MKKVCVGPLLLATLLALAPAGSEAAVYVVEPLLVAQPAYSGMTFYAYRPYNMAPGWYVTFDGYAIRQEKSGLWVYGSFDGKELVPTSYIVGSVNPQTLPLGPYVSLAEISSLQTVPVAPLYVQPQPVVPVEGGNAAGQIAVNSLPPTYVPDWMTSPAFTAIASWNLLVDRMGILEKPRLPIAWMGDRPAALFVWTGKTWYKIQSPSTDFPPEPAALVRRHVYDLTRMTKDNHYRWKDGDTALLAHQATSWGYLWMGQIAPSK